MAQAQAGGQPGPAVLTYNTCQLTCPSCLEVFSGLSNKRICATTCGHVYHVDCWQHSIIIPADWKRRGKPCLVCRRVVTTFNIYPEFYDDDEEDVVPVTPVIPADGNQAADQGVAEDATNAAPPPPQQAVPNPAAVAAAVAALALAAGAGNGAATAVVPP